MIKLRSLVLILSCAVLLACGRSETAPEGLPNTGNWVLINYWATWCGPCRDEIPELNTLNAEHADIDVFGANYDRLQGQELQDAIAELDIQFASMMADPAELLAQERPRVLPTTYVLSPNGELHAVLTGPQTEESLLKAMGRD
ncbi:MULTISPECIES: TlpA family protein disulfide reductase [Spongiibacter]|uniref:TlpA family protein disulfide reductase n=1 Tax=Spongiibacter TaxID=630749 RepID=UPI0003B398CD|nr:MULTISPECIES: TlpA disulfide reductase family protein [Spongiibacter]MBO6751975.1 TlpA family protein disulfide reductase [Spongiibacter sp.]|tara:strand:- start:4170 stop:4598 length:429 start_codon:yes stop_codon:yes gene_type:complete